MTENSDSEYSDSQASYRPLKRKSDKSDSKLAKRSKHCRASKAKWTAAEDEVLTSSVNAHGEGNWKKIAQALAERSHLQCLHRWQKVLNPALVKGPWKDEEDSKLVELVEACGPKEWSIIASHIPGRIGKQCRERWFNHLSPDVRKTNWSAEEDHIIVDSHLRLGNKWTAISKLLNGRPANAIKNHWNSTLLKRLQESNVNVKPERAKAKSSAARNAASVSTPSLSEGEVTDETDSSHSAVNTPPLGAVSVNFDSSALPPPMNLSATPWEWTPTTSEAADPSSLSSLDSVGMNTSAPNSLTSCEPFEFGLLDEPSPLLHDTDFSDDNGSSHFDDFQPGPVTIMPQVQHWFNPTDEFDKSALDFHNLGMEMPGSFYPFPADLSL